MREKCSTRIGAMPVSQITGTQRITISTCKLCERSSPRKTAGNAKRRRYRSLQLDPSILLLGHGHVLSNRTPLGLFLILAGFGVNSASAQSESDASSIAQAFRDGAFGLALRYRYEHVDQDGFSANANASVLRTRLTFETARLRGFSLALDVDDLRTIGADGFNSTRNGNTELPTVADPTATELNQLLIRHVSASGLDVSLGRQRLTSSSRRFVGSINWRQNEQTFDSVAAVRSFGSGTEASYAYVYDSTISGDQGILAYMSGFIYAEDTPLPLGTLADFRFVPGPRSIERENHRAKVRAIGDISPAASFPATALPAQKRVVSVSSV